MFQQTAFRVVQKINMHNICKYDAPTKKSKKEYVFGIAQAASLCRMALQGIADVTMIWCGLNRGI